MKKYTNPIVEVLWHDAVTSFGWEEKEDVAIDEEICVTIGFLIKKGDNVVVVSSTIDSVNGNQSNSRIKIPIEMIKSMREVTINYKKEKSNAEQHTQSNPQ